eukprot:4650376-Lingulodinium_polyedra.AAC.1
MMPLAGFNCRALAALVLRPMARRKGGIGRPARASQHLLWTAVSEPRRQCSSPRMRLRKSWGLLVS